MKEIINPNYIPCIKTNEIRYIEDDYVLKMKDLEDLKVVYDKSKRQLIASFKPIYIYSLEQMIKVDSIFFSYFEKTRFNGYYERLENKPHKLIVGKDVEEYFNDLLEKYYKKEIVLEEF